MSPKTETNGYRPFSKVLASGDRANGCEKSSSVANSATVHNIFLAAYRDLCSFAQKIVGSQEMAQDVVQQAFTNTLTAMGRGAEIRNINGYLNRSVRNLAIDHIRRISDHESIDDKIEHLAEGSQLTSSEVKEQYKEVATAVDDLVPSQRRAFLLSELKGLGYEEIANEMNRSTDSVRMLLCRARRRVRAAVGANRELAGVSAPVLVGKTKWLSWLKAKVTNLQAGFDNWVQNTMNTVAQHSPTVVAGALVVVIPIGTVGLIIKQEPVSLDHRAVITSKTSSGLVSLAEPRTTIKKPGVSSDGGGEVNAIIRNDRPSLDSTRSSDGSDKAGGTKTTVKREIDASAARQVESEEQGAGGGNPDPGNGRGYDGSIFFPDPPDPPPGVPPPGKTADITPSQPGSPMGANKGAPIPSDPVGKPSQPGVIEPIEPEAETGIDNEPEADSPVIASQQVGVVS